MTSSMEGQELSNDAKRLDLDRGLQNDDGQVGDYHIISWHIFPLLLFHPVLASSYCKIVICTRSIFFYT